MLLLSMLRCRYPAMARTLIIAALVLGCLALATAQSGGPCIECNVSGVSWAQHGQQHPSTAQLGHQCVQP